MIFRQVAVIEGELRPLKKRLFGLGLLMLVLGLVALALPLWASITLETILGGVMIILGLGGAFQAWRTHRAGSQSWHSVAVAALAFVIGLVLLLFPAAGAVTLGLIVGLYFVAQGVVTLGQYVQVRHLPGSLWLLASGVVSLLLAFPIWRNWLSAAIAPGVLLGINLLFSGTSLIALARGCGEALHRGSEK